MKRGQEELEVAEHLLFRETDTPEEVFPRQVRRREDCFHGERIDDFARDAHPGIRKDRVRQRSARKQRGNHDRLLLSGDAVAFLRDQEALSKRGCEKIRLGGD